MSEKKWFLLIENKVTGPFTETEVNNSTPAHPKALVWGKGMPEWLPPSDWKKIKEQKFPDLKISPEIKKWSWRIGSLEKGSFLFHELVEILRKEKDFSQIDIKESDEKGWIEIYGIPKLVEALGITRRQSARVPIMGSYAFDHNGFTISSRVVTVAEGGLGLSEPHDLKIGSQIKGIFTSPHLPMPINCHCEVVYLGNDGYTGLKFTFIPAEGTSAIIEYINKFQNPGTE